MLQLELLPDRVSKLQRSRYFPYNTNPSWLIFHCLGDGASQARRPVTPYDWLTAIVFAVLWL